MDKKKKILIVEDDEINSFILLKCLQDDFLCDCARNGEQTAKSIDDTEYDVILMDINLGNDSLNGEELMKIIKFEKKNLTTKIVAITSYAMDGDKEHFLEVGFDYYFAKPVQKDELISSIRKMLEI